MNIKATLLSMLVIFNLCASAQWVQRNQGLSGGNVLCLKEFNGVIFAGTSGAGVFISNDNGGTWTISSLGLPKQPMVTSLAKIGTTIFAGLYDGGVYKSTDNGTTWIAPPIIFSPLRNINSLYVSGDNLYAGGYGGLYMSSDFGATWISRNNGLPSDPWIKTIASTSTSLIVGIFYKGVYRSNDSGATWQALPGLAADADVQSIAVSDGNIIAGATNTGFYLSIDNGDSWTSLGGVTLEIIYSLSYVGSTLFAGTFGSGLYKSANNGSSWSSVNLGRVNSVNSILPMGSNIFVGTSDGVYRSQDGGINWSSANTNLMALGVNSIDASGSKVLASANFNNGVFFSADQAANWSSVSLPATSTNASEWPVLVSNDSLIFGMLESAVKISTNGGATWSNYANDATALMVQGGDVYRGAYRGLFVFRKNGSGWESLTNGINQNQWISSLASMDSAIFAGTIIGQGVLRSTDQGATWTEVNNGFSSVGPIVGLYTSNDKLFAVTNNNFLYVSIDLGNSWTLHSQNFTEGFIEDIVFDSTVGYMANAGGVYITLNNGETWVESTYSLPSYVAPLSIARNESTLFLGTSVGIYSMPLSAYFPEISDFSPTTGDAGTSVTIQGKHFTTPEYVKVKFNGVVAEVVASTPTSIIAKVPPGATTGPITVEIAGHSGTSSQDFCVKPVKPVITGNFTNSANPKLLSSSIDGNQWYLNETMIAGATAQSLSQLSSGSYTVQVTRGGCSSQPSDVYCFEIPKPSITSDFSNPAQVVLTSSNDTGNQWFRNGIIIEGERNKTLTTDESGSFTVHTTEFGCTSPFSAAVVMVFTGEMIHPQAEPNKLIVYPSPSTQYINISLWNPTSSRMTLDIYDIFGHHVKVIRSDTEFNAVEDVSDYPSGIYFIKATVVNGSYQARFIKH